MNLTKKQKILLDYVDEFIKTHDYSPTLREIMNALGYKSVSTVAKHVDNLVVIGKLSKKDGEVRSLSVAGQEEVGSRWANLEEEIARRRSSQDVKLLAEAEILQQALDILQ